MTEWKLRFSTEHLDRFAHGAPLLSKYDSCHCHHHYHQSNDHLPSRHAPVGSACRGWLGWTVWRRGWTWMNRQLASPQWYRCRTLCRRSYCYCCCGYGMDVLVFCFAVVFGLWKNQRRKKAKWHPKAESYHVRIDRSSWTLGETNDVNSQEHTGLSVHQNGWDVGSEPIVDDAVECKKRHRCVLGI